MFSLDAAYGCMHFLCSSGKATLLRDCSSKWHLRRTRRPGSKSRYDYGFSLRYPPPLLSSVHLQCLRLLPPAAAPLLPDLVLTPYMPVPDTNGEEWDRLEAATGIDALLELIMHGEYNGQDAVRRQKESVDLRATAVGVFEVLIWGLVG